MNMNKILVCTKAVLTMILTVIADALGGFDSALSLLVTLVVVDFITGLAYATLTNKVSSSEMRMGIVRKLLVFTVIFVAFQVDKVILDVTGTGLVLFGKVCSVRLLFIIYACIEESISLIENLANLGVPFPQSIKDVLEKVSDCADASIPRAIIEFIKKHFGIDISGKHEDDVNSVEDKSKK